MKWRTLEEEVDELRDNPTARALLSDWDILEEERSELLTTTLTSLADIGEGFSDGYS
jgi:hypothetical protein